MHQSDQVAGSHQSIDWRRIPRMPRNHIRRMLPATLWNTVGLNTQSPLTSLDVASFESHLLRSRRHAMRRSIYRFLPRSVAGRDVYPVAR